MRLRGLQTSRLMSSWQQEVVSSEANDHPELKLSTLGIEAATFDWRIGCTPVYTPKRLTNSYLVFTGDCIPKIMRYEVWPRPA